MRKVIISSIVGTSLMTAFSYWKARKEREQFEEPILLGKIVHHLAPQKINLQSAIVAGWFSHYFIGLSMVMGYDCLLKKTAIEPGVASGLALGAPSGLLGMAAWAAVLKNHPNPPQTNLKKHLKQLFIAHIVFGVTSGVVYRLLQNQER